MPIAENSILLAEMEKVQNEVEEAIKNFEHDSFVRDDIRKVTEGLLSILSHVTTIEESISTSENEQQNTADKIRQEVLGIIIKNIGNAVSEIKPLFFTLNEYVNNMKALNKKILIELQADQK